MKPKILLFLTVVICIFLCSSQGMGQWNHVPTPLNVYCLASHGSDVFAGSFDTSGVWISADNGESWKAIGDTNFVGVYSLAFMGDHWFAGTYEKGVWLSTNFGASWAAANNGIEQQDIYGLTSLGSDLVAIGLGGIFRSTDSGATWKRTSDKYAFESSANPLATGNGNIYAATVGGLLRSSDGGSSWMTIQDSMYWAVAADDQNVFASNDSGFFRSTDQGNSWIRSSSKTYGLIYLNGGNIFGGPSRGNDVTSFISTDYGVHWTDLKQDNRSTALIVSGPNIVKGSNNTGIWYRPLSGIFSAVRTDDRSKTDLSVYPNPTTGISTIRTTSSADIGPMTLTNSLGINISELPAPSSSEFRLDLSNLPAGIYYLGYTINGSVTRRMIVKE